MGKKVPAFSSPAETVSPPNRSTNDDYELAHDEAFGLQVLARQELTSALAGDGDFDWMRFVSEPTPYKSIRDGATALAFLRTKMTPRKKEVK
jgi:hypothetical protein